MMIVITLYIFTVGLVLGSFFNVVGLRVPMKQSIVKPRSACPTCSKTLNASQLVPVFSYLWQRGKCKNCSTRISPIYPCMELLTGILFVVTFYVIGFEPELIVGLTLVSLFIILTVSDIAYMLIPNKILMFFFGLFVVERICIPLTPWYDSIIGAVVGFVLLYLIAILSRGGMGGGDVKLYAVLGFVLGWQLVLLSFFLSTFAGAVGGGIGMLLGKVKRGQPMPFGPFIMIGTLTAYFVGEDIIQWYVTSFFL